MCLMNKISDIFFSVNTFSHYPVNPRCVLLIVEKHVMRYLKGMLGFRLYYDRDHDYRLYGYTDSYWEGSFVERKSTTCGCYCVGSAMISWFRKKQSSVSLSTTEAEYKASCSASYEAIWI